MGVPSYRISHERRYVSYILNTLLGGGMSSRLFQNVREKQGLVYSIFSELNPFRDTGLLSVYAGTSRESAPKVVQSIVNEFRQLKQNPISEEELKRAKDQLKGSLMLSLESSTARMSNLARQEMYYDRFFSMDEIIERIQAVTVEDLLQSANELFQPERIAVTVLGNLNGLKITPRFTGLLRKKLISYQLSAISRQLSVPSVHAVPAASESRGQTFPGGERPNRRLSGRGGKMGPRCGLSVLPLASSSNLCDAVDMGNKNAPRREAKKPPKKKSKATL